MEDGISNFKNNLIGTLMSGGEKMPNRWPHMDGFAFFHVRRSILRICSTVRRIRSVLRVTEIGRCWNLCGRLATGVSLMWMWTLEPSMESKRGNPSSLIHAVSALPNLPLFDCRNSIRHHKEDTTRVFFLSLLLFVHLPFFPR